MTRNHDDRGSSTLELAVLSIGLLLVVSAIIAIGRIQIASHGVEEAARAAAREASIARTAAEARANAIGAATSTLTDQGLTCQGMSVEVDLADFAKAAGARGTVTAHVSCNVLLSDVMLPVLPGRIPITAQIDSPIDTYRESSR
ncbi:MULTISPECIES: TadE/TadG family type IV pilus assembly protein [unclassified Nocardiopsis]|uniref:TadE/TadG family type IV pilus assembly protein n=1 Tax=unclassified Nocardiopsis TaxID=2649073 RepID=UPI0013578F0B|nr:MULTISPECIES: TadE/TadG family type IV pilus assembly protein [unclassified Nocardiopsis]